MTDVVQVNTFKSGYAPQKEVELPWKSKTPASMLYTKKPTLITAIADRLPSIFLPHGNRDQSASGQYEFLLTTDQGFDFTTATLDFNLALTNCTYINNAANIINRMECYWNDTNLEILQDANVWTNVFLAMAANKSWMTTEGNALMGLYNQACWGRTQTADTEELNEAKRYYTPQTGVLAYPSGARAGVSTYQVPLSLVSGLFRVSNIIPVIGGKVRIKIYLAPSKEVCGYTVTTAPTYSITNMCMHMDQVVFERSYRDMIETAANSSEGILIPFISYQCGSAQCTQTKLQSFRIPFNLTNALSLHIVREHSAQVEPDTKTWVCPRICYPMSEFSSLTVKAGSKYFTPSQGIRSFSELYRSCELTHNNFCDISGSGIVDMKLMTEAYTQQTVTGTGNLLLAAGICPMSVSLEKVVEEDADVSLNNGLNAGDGFTEITVELTTGSDMATADTLFWNLVHKRYISIKNRAVTCMF